MSVLQDLFAQVALIVQASMPQFTAKLVPQEENVQLGIIVYLGAPQLKHALRPCISQLNKHQSAKIVLLDIIVLVDLKFNPVQLVIIVM